MGDNTTAVDFLLEHLKQLINSKDINNQFSEVEKLQIKSLYDDLSLFKTFLIDSWYKHEEEVKDLVIRITDMANEAEDIIDLSIVSDIVEKKNRVGGVFAHVYQSGVLINVLNEITSLKKEVSGGKQSILTLAETQERLRILLHIQKAAFKFIDARADVPIVEVEEEETVVGFDNDLKAIKERLVGGSKKLDVISIVGMPGLGKTTVAKKWYNDDFIVYHFYIRGWTSVSQVYAKRDMLRSILSSVVGQRDELFYTMIDEELGERLFKHLKGKTYLIVMDDMWDTKAWDDMRIYFPNDNNGSRIIITSRLSEVALHAKHKSPAYLLPLLTKDASWDLLKLKVFGKGSCTPNLVEIGEKIAQNCQGLPLAIVVVAGLLARTDTVKEEWEKLSESLSSLIAGDLEQCMNNTLELSYYHLPRHLRLCFLYFGAFPEDYEICVRKLICLWIAEGFIHQIGQKTLEDVAEEYLTDLIGRSLVIVAKRKFSGGIRTCRVHDMLRDLCLRKGKEENFMQQICRHETFSSCLIPIGEKQRRLCPYMGTTFREYIKHLSSLQTS